MFLLFRALVAFLLVALGEAAHLETLSFEPPFNEVDSGGVRMVKNWKSAGSTMVSQNFVRLTPDRQSKKGSLWSRRPLGVDSFSAILKFRISGQAKTFFGDGVALWITNHSYYTEGDLHGCAEKFLGVGIIFDTFKNTESLAAHRDVTILVNDGEKTWEMMTEDVQGCNMNVRYHNERADFTATDASRVQLTVTETTLKVMVDAKNSGEWLECANLEKLDLPAGWVRDAFIGLTASTGQLADNHDVISLVTDSESTQAIADAPLDHPGTKDRIELNTALAPMDMDKIIIDRINAQSKSLEELVLHVEHEFASIKEKINNLVGRLEKREENAEKRIDSLEQVIKTEVEGTITSRLEQLEHQIKGNLDTKINTINRQLDIKLGSLETVAKQATESVASGGGHVRLIFVALGLFLVAILAGFFYFYRLLTKKHIL